MRDKLSFFPLLSQSPNVYVCIHTDIYLHILIYRENYTELQYTYYMHHYRIMNEVQCSLDSYHCLCRELLPCSRALKAASWHGVHLWVLGVCSAFLHVIFPLMQAMHSSTDPFQLFLRAYLVSHFCWGHLALVVRSQVCFCRYHSGPREILHKFVFPTLENRCAIKDFSLL